MALTEERKIYLRKWYKENRNEQRKRIAENKRVWRLNNLELAREIDKEKSIKYRKRRLTYGKVKWAVDSGKIMKPKMCTNCNKRKKLFGHHKDYNKPLEVTWICMDCHMKEHHLSDLIKELNLE